MPLLPRALMFCAVLCLSSGLAQAAIVPISPPVSVLPGALENGGNIHLFQEQADVTLTSALQVDVSAIGLYFPGSALSPSVIPAGTRVASYMLHSDPRGIFPTQYTGYWVAPRKIIGIILSDSRLDASDAILGNPGTLYPTGVAHRGLDFSLPIFPDLLFFDGSQLLATVFRTGTVVDQIRVITLVPEPSTFALAGLGLAGMALVAMRRRKK